MLDRGSGHQFSSQRDAHLVDEGPELAACLCGAGDGGQVITPEITQHAMEDLASAWWRRSELTSEGEDSSRL